ncbi:MAG: N-acetylmuramoyl-L-alanine amidase [Myxococcota bacterium]
MDRAVAADSALERSEPSLRQRHRHIRVIKLWQTVAFRGPEEERCSAKTQEARAWTRLAHWSGSAADRRRARQVQAGLCVQGTPATTQSAPSVESSAAVTAPPGAPTIVLDPGHGGEEKGARGPGGLWEKDYNLDVAQRLRRLLEGRYHVLMTRQDDSTVGLAERVQVANRSEAVLFVSIHGNAHSQRRFHGIETYVLDVEARRFEGRLEDREARLRRPEYPTETPEHIRDVELLLASMAMREATRRSEHLAQAVQEEVVHALRKDVGPIRSLGLRRALFHVLLGARMPAVLVESGFLSHPVEGRRMMQDTWRTAVAQGLARGIDAYFTGREAPDGGGYLAHLVPEISASMTHSISGSRGKSESAK